MISNVDDKHIEVWKNINKGDNSFFDKENYDKIADVNLISSFFTKLVKRKDVSNGYNLDFSYLDKLNKELSSVDGHKKFYDEVYLRGYIEIKSPISGNALKSRFNFISNFFNFVRFDDTEETFYLIQGFDPLCGIYFPNRDLLVSYNTFTNCSPCERFIKTAMRQLRNFFRNYKESNTYIFKGYFISHTRPWHYFYNLLPGYVNIVKDSDKELMVLTRKGGDFYPLHTISSNADISYHSLHSVSWFSFQHKHKSFILSPGFRLSGITEELECSIVEIMHKSLEDQSINIESFDASKPTIWIGIQNQKRCWIEQVQGLYKCIMHVAVKNDGVNVIVDGWTSPINISGSDIEQIDIDKELFSELESMISEQKLNVNLLSIIGETPIKKNKYASVVDYAITNYATGSLYTSRFNKVASLCHLNNRMNKSQHFHYNTKSIDKNLIKDIDTQDSMSHHVSYSISPDLFLKEFVCFLSEID